MGEIKIILISRRWPDKLLKKLRQGIGLAPKKAGNKLFRTYSMIKEKQENKKI